MLRLRVGHEQSRFEPILAHLLDYYSVLRSQSDFHDWETLGVRLRVGH